MNNTNPAGTSPVKKTKRKPTGAAALGAGPGRPKGSGNKTTTVLKDAILAAATATGLDGKGKEGLTGYLKAVARDDVKAFSALLGKVLPLQLTGADGGAIQTENKWEVQLVSVNGLPPNAA